MSKQKKLRENCFLYFTPKKDYTSPNYLSFNINKSKVKKNSTQIGKAKKNIISPMESLAIINKIKHDNNLEMLLVYYFLYIKGLNFTAISRLMLTHFRNGFEYLILKKGKRSKYKIDISISQKLYEYFKSQKYITKFFFFNKIIDNDKTTRVSFIKGKMENILNRAYGLKEYRKAEILKIFSFIRSPKWAFDLDIFINDVGFTYGFFDPDLSIFPENSISHKINNNNNELSSFLPEEEEQSESLKKEINDINNINKNDDNEFLNKNLDRAFDTFEFKNLTFLKSKNIFDSSERIKFKNKYIDLISES